MNIVRTAALATIMLLPLIGCSEPSTSPTAGQDESPETLLGKAVKQATDEARKDLADGNIDLSSGVSGQPKAEITPTGDLLIGGKPLALTDEQRSLSMEYRKQIAAVAEAGIEVGLQGADLAGKAVTEALKGVLSGDPDQVERKIEAEAEKIKVSAVKLCEQLPALFAAQNKLADAVPEFKPYAKMDQSDIDECMNHDNADIAKTQEEIRNEIRDGIRSGIRETIQSTVGQTVEASTDDQSASVAKTQDEIRNEIREGIRNGIRETIQSTVGQKVQAGADDNSAGNAAEEAEAAGDTVKK